LSERKIGTRAMHFGDRFGGKPRIGRVGQIFRNHESQVPVVTGWQFLSQGDIPPGQRHPVLEIRFDGSLWVAGWSVEDLELILELYDRWRRSR
jgi:hypothetical protein